MMCFKHNRYYRAGHCPKCIEEIEQEIQDKHELIMLEREAKQPIVLWEKR